MISFECLLPFADEVYDLSWGGRQMGRPPRSSAIVAQCNRARFVVGSGAHRQLGNL